MKSPNLDSLLLAKRKGLITEEAFQDTLNKIVEDMYFDVSGEDRTGIVDFFIREVVK